MMKNTQSKYDSLEYATELKEVGFTEAQAKVQAKALFQIVEQQLVTKQDVQNLEDKLTSNTESSETKINYKIDKLEAAVNHKIDTLEAAVNHKIDTLDHKIDTLETTLNLNIISTKNDVIFKLGGLMVFLFTASGVLLRAFGKV